MTKNFRFPDRSPATEANMPPGTKALGYTRNQVDSLVLASLMTPAWVGLAVADYKTQQVSGIS